MHIEISVAVFGDIEWDCSNSDNAHDGLLLLGPHHDHKP